jgi:HD superfamily phosphohydrolase
MEIRDPIHGFIEYKEIEEKLINTCVFQRLRNIKQLALANYVYPGAVHTRFEHSLGVMHLAGKIAKNLNIDKDRIKIIRIAGLLHDIGHGPFSHVSEQLLEKYSNNLKSLVDKYDAENAHELMSILIIKNNKEIGKIFKEDKIEVEEVVKLIKKYKKAFIEKDIISGPLDADKLDYLLRDSYFTGVKYGIFDLEKIIESFKIIKISSEEERIGIDYEGVYALEQFLLSNYHMRMQVYYHRIRRISDAMIIRGIEIAIDEGIKELGYLFNIKDDEDYFKKFIKYDDRIIQDIIIKDSKGMAKEFFRKLIKRDLLKEVLNFEITSEVFDKDVITYDRSLKLDENYFKKISKEISKWINDKYNIDIPSEFIILDRQSFSNPTFRTPGVRIDINTIYILEKGIKKDFTDFSKVFKNSTIEPKSNFMYLYAPIEDNNKKNEISKTLKDYLIEIIKGENLK